MDDFETFDRGTGDKLRQIAKTLRDHPLAAHERKVLAHRLDEIAKGR